MLKSVHFFGSFFLITSPLLMTTADYSLAEPLPQPPSVEQSEQQTRREYKFKAPNAAPSNFPSPSREHSKLYRVQINRSSKRALLLVQTIKPNAFIKESENIIQAGLFSNQSNARELVQTLLDRGINAEIVPVSQSQVR